jgi:hypothetical protein
MERDDQLMAVLSEMIEVTASRATHQPASQPVVDIFQHESRNSTSEHANSFVVRNSTMFLASSGLCTSAAKMKKIVFPAFSALPYT